MYYSESKDLPQDSNIDNISGGMLIINTTTGFKWRSRIGVEALYKKY